MKLNRILICSMILLLIPASAYAETTTGTGIGGVKNTLDAYELPEVSPLEMPTLSKNYENMSDEMYDLGFGNYRFKGALPLPDVEAPTGTGTNAYDVFVGTYGDLWSDPARQLDKTSKLPVAEVLNAASSFSLKAESSFATIKQADTVTMSKLLSKQLDTSKNWDLSAVKSGLPKMSTAQLSTHMAGLQLPSGYGSDAEAPSVSSQYENLSDLAGQLGIDIESFRTHQEAGTLGAMLDRDPLMKGLSTITDPIADGIVNGAIYTAKKISVMPSAAQLADKLLGKPE